ncbi:MAG: fructosamine kinase family protein [Pseudomonadota bacterium]|nr:fructosamine kinase family protein [Pseudomonadota bacterium]
MVRGTIQQDILDWLAERLGHDYTRARVTPSGAGCINETYAVQRTGLPTVFIKVGHSDQWAMYQQEQRGLALLRQCETIRVPEVYGAENLESCALLALEFISLSPLRSAAEPTFGRALAQLHSITANAYGLDHNNFIGRSHQINDWHSDWWTFFCEKRLRPQRMLAQIKGMRSTLLTDLERLMEVVPAVLSDHTPPASLLHGDLWSGNMAVDENGTPTLFDPAVYYGDGETDLAMSRMFGGPGAGFYQAYHEIQPLQEGHELRRSLYDLYHWLNHFNLFGVGYLGQVELTLDALLREMD